MNQMTRILLLSACLIAATSGQALAYSNVSPREPSHVTAIDRNDLGSFDRPEQAHTLAADSYHYRGGPKTND
jgi:hypothetical protein